MSKPFDSDKREWPKDREAHDFMAGERAIEALERFANAVDRLARVAELFAAFVGGIGQRLTDHILSQMTPPERKQ